MSFDLSNAKSGRGAFVKRSDLTTLIARLDPQGGAKEVREVSCSVQNASGAAREIFDALQITDVVVGPSDDENEYLHNFFFVGEPIDTDDTQKFCVLQYPAGSSDVVTAVYSGVTVVRLTGEIDKDFATTKSGQTALESADSGPCAILYDPGPENEERYAIVRIGAGGGGGGVIVTANIVEMSEDCSCAYCEVGGESCGAKDIPDHIWVQDGLGCFFDQPAEVLIGMGLIAARMKGQNDCGDDPYAGGGECDYWIVLNMCCPETEGE